MAAPRLLSVQYRQRLARPIRDALIAFRLGRANEDHYYDLAGPILIALELAQLVPRHRHLVPDINQGQHALDVVRERQQQRTVDDSFWTATESEIQALELAVDIYAALLVASSGKHTNRAMRRVLTTLERKMKERT